ncbi:MAG TPA: helix-turn-helix domain-containing protein [Polyangiaceae bacterium]|nr:helix-turn-helix domain-containing protein [Polyangiaceae bacterium]
MGSSGTRGILNPLHGFQHFKLEREAPPDDLAAFVAGFWRVTWDLEEHAAFEQEILPYPCVNLAFEQGAFQVHGPGTQRFVARLSGRGSAFGVRFKPAGFFAFSKVPLRSLVDRVLPVELATERAPALPEDANGVRHAACEFLRRFEARRDEKSLLVDELVDRAQSDRGVARAEDLAQIAGLSVRSLHRLFEQYVGVGPKWVVRRSRVQEAAERVASGARVDWARTAQELGYHDQAHLIRDFREQVGFTPEAYARRCAAANATYTDANP